MHITNADLDAIEKTANKKRNAEALLLVQVLREVRELKSLLKQQNEAGHSGNDGANGTRNCDNEKK